MSAPRDKDDALTAPYVLEYTYRRSLGPVLSRFMTGLREQRIFGLRTRDGRVLVPPPECDPMTGESLEEWVEVACCGEIVTWAWMDRPRRNQPLSEPFAWALIRLDGADSSLLHVVSVPSVEAMRTGMRVQASWRKERVGHMKDIACFIPEVS